MSTEQAVIVVEIAWGDPEQQHRLSVQVPAQSSIDDALYSARLLEGSAVLPPLDFAGVTIFGQRCSAATRLRDGDRIELLRGLQADPKDARRARVQAQRKPGSR